MGLGAEQIGNESEVLLKDHKRAELALQLNFAEKAHLPTVGWLGAVTIQCTSSFPLGATWSQAASPVQTFTWASNCLRHRVRAQSSAPPIVRPAARRSSSAPAL